MTNPFRELKWWFNYRFVKRHKYNVVYTDLEPGYYDIDTLMLEGCMKLLKRYVEHERDGAESLQKWVDELKADAQFDGSVDQSKMEQEALDIYRWWTEKRPADLKRLDVMVNELYPAGGGTANTQYTIRDYGDLRDAIDKDEDEMLTRMVKIRRSLWS